MKKEKIMTIKYYVILILLLLSLFVVLIYAKKVYRVKNVTKVKIKETKKEAVPEPEETYEDLDVNSDLIKELTNKVSGFDSIKAGSYYGYFYQNNYLDLNSISDDAKIAIGITQNENFKSDFINATYEAEAPDGNKLNVIILAKKEIQEGINDFFGPNTTYKDTNLKDADKSYCGFSGFKFDETRNVYMNDPISCANFPEDYIDTKVINAQKKGEIVEFTLKIAYIKYEVIDADNVIKYIYKSNNSGNYLEKHNILTDNSYEINNILDKLDSFKFTFKLHSNNYYYFDKVEKL